MEMVPQKPRIFATDIFRTEELIDKRPVGGWEKEETKKDAKGIKTGKNGTMYKIARGYNRTTAS